MASTIPLSRQMMRVIPADQLDREGDESSLKRTMGLLALTMFSVGSIVGTGIFVVLGEAVPKAGPAVLLSFVLAAITCAFSAFSYAELAGSIPVSGSSYSYAYATLGEIIAWICGWCLMLEYGVSVAAVAVGWGQYLNEFLSVWGIEIPPQFANPPGEGGGVFNITAVIVVLACAFLLLRGASESATINTIMVFIKIGILLFFCAVAFTTFEPGNFMPFAPLGFAGISAAAGQVFFSYIGFDAASTCGEEAKNAKKDLPRAIILSLIIVTILYVLVTAAAIGARPWQDFEGAGAEAVLATIARDVTGSNWAPTLIALGAVISIFSVVLVTMYGQTRILFAMGRDGMLPKLFKKVNPRTQTPVANTIVVTVIISILAGFIPLGQLAEATSIGTLAAFAIVNFGVIALWRARPELERTFKVPLMPLMPILGVVLCIYLISSLAWITWVVFFSWMAVGILIYIFYSRSHSNAPSERPIPLADERAAVELSTRSMSVGTIVGIVLLVITAVAAVLFGASQDGINVAQQIAWYLTGIACVVGIVMAVRGLAADRSAVDGVQAGEFTGAAVKMRSAIMSIAVWLLIPGLLAVLSVTFASGPAAKGEAEAAPVSPTTTVMTGVTAERAAGPG